MLDGQPESSGRLRVPFGLQAVVDRARACRRVLKHDESKAIGQANCIQVRKPANRAQAGWAWSSYVEGRWHVVWHVAMAREACRRAWTTLHVKGGDGLVLLA